MTTVLQIDCPPVLFATNVVITHACLCHCTRCNRCIDPADAVNHDHDQRRQRWESLLRAARLRVAAR